MFQKKKHNLIPAGDYVTAAESKLDADQDIERRCESVAEVVKDKVFPLARALSVYNVSFRQYVGYMMLRDKSKIIIKSSDVGSIVTNVLDMMDFSNSHLDSNTEKMVAGLRQLSAVK